MDGFLSAELCQWQAPARERIASVMLLVAMVFVVLCGSVVCAGAASDSKSGGKPHSVKLSWHPSDSPIAAGYNVYRSSERNGAQIRINRKPLKKAQFVDTHVEAGHTYYYRVAALNKRKGESAQSEPIMVKVPGP